jgi:phage-related protein
MAENVGSVSLGVTIDSKNVEDDIKDVGTKSGGVFSSIFSSTASSGISGALGTIKTAIVGLGTTIATGGGLFALADNAVQAGDAVYELSEKMHLPTDQAALLSRELSFTDTDSQSFIGTMTKLDKAVESAGTKGNATTDAMKQFGLTLTDGNGKLLPMNQQLASLAAAYQKASDNGNDEAFTAQLLGSRGVALTGILSDYNDVAAEAGKVKSIGIDPEQAHQVSLEMETLKDQIGAIGTTVGSAVLPVVLAAIPPIQSGLAGIAEEIKSHQAQIQSFASIIGGVLGTVATAVEGVFNFIASNGPLVLGVIGGIAGAMVLYNGVMLVANTITTITNGLAAISAARTAFSTGATLAQVAATETATGAQIGLNMALLANPITWIIVGIVALVAAVILLFNNCKPFHDFIMSAFNEIKAVAIPIIAAIQQAITDAWNVIGPTITNGIKTVQTFWNSIWPEIKQVFSDVWTAMKVLLAPAVAVLYTIINTELGFIKGAWDGVWNAIKDTFKTLWDLITGVVKTAWDLISGIIKTALDIITGVFKIFQDLFTGNWGALWGDVKSLFSNVWSDISGTFSNVTEDIGNIFKNLASDALQWGSDLISGFIGGIKGAVGGLGDAVKNVAGIIASFLHFSAPDQGPLADYETWMPDMMTGLAKGVTDNKDKIVTAMTDVTSSMSGATKAGLSALTKTASSDYDNLATKISDRTAKLKNDIQAVIDNYNSQVSSLASTMMSTTSIFSQADITAPAANDSSTLITDLGTQVQQLQNYKDAMDGLKSKGVSGSLLTELQKQGPAATQQLQALNAMTSTQLSTYEGLWNDKTKLATQDATAQLSGVKAQSTTQIQALNKQAGVDLQGYVTQWSNSSSSVETGLKTLASKTSGYGSDMISGLIKGLNSQKSALSAAVSGIAKTISSQLHFSTPDVGPLANYETWMPDFIGGLAGGITNNTGLLTSAIQNVTAKMSSAMQSGINSSLNTSTLLSLASGGNAASSTNITNNNTKAPVININGPVNLADKGDTRATLQQTQFLTQI